jgi:hypothetical protein
VEHSPENKYDEIYSDKFTLSMNVKMMAVKLNKREKQNLLHLMSTKQRNTSEENTHVFITDMSGRSLI